MYGIAIVHVMIVCLARIPLLHSSVIAIPSLAIASYTSYSQRLPCGLQSTGYQQHPILLLTCPTDKIDLIVTLVGQSGLLKYALQRSKKLRWIA